ncbi:MAG: XRE family plasmid maintenance system antidote protein [uncultured bacterium]|nr:MAG: XRE family plasmid maintenance system antidote protein [uncultured bacterium]
MSAPMKKPPINQANDIILIRHAGVVYQFPKKIAAKYRVSGQSVNAASIFVNINKKYTKPGALLRGIRARENLTQIEMAKHIKVTQSDISQMENGTRKIGRTIAKRIQKLFDVDYRSFLE